MELSVFRRQQDGVVGEAEIDPIERKIGERDVLHIDDIVVAIVANEFRGAVGIHISETSNFAT